MDESILREWLSNSDYSKNGLNHTEAEKRLKSFGPNEPPRSRATWRASLFNQFKSPLVILLLFATLMAGFLGEWTDASIVLCILAMSIGLSFFQEFSATKAVEKLKELIETRVTVLREGAEKEQLVREIVPGDLVCLEAGAHIPADGLVLRSNSLLVNEAVLTGESAAVEKIAATDAAYSLKSRLMAGTYVQSGQGQMLVLQTGATSELGNITKRIALQRPETEFQRGIRQYGYLLTEFTLLLTLAVFAMNIAFHRPWIDSFLFSLALAIGLTPQLLPAIISITLAKGAKDLAAKKVITRRLESIEDFGSMDVLCSDKTGTLTIGQMRLKGCYGCDGEASNPALVLAAVNAKFQTGFQNPIDDAIVANVDPDVFQVYEPVSTIPYDFFRRRLSVIVRQKGGRRIITKGAVESVLQCCSQAIDADRMVPINEKREEIDQQFQNLSADGMRVLAVACRDLSPNERVDGGCEQHLTFHGLVALEDPLREDSAEMVKTLASKGVSLKLITGDNRFVASHVALPLGLAIESILLGDQLNAIPSQALPAIAAKTQIFAEVNPLQKEQIILALKKFGNVVGYIGDGINDVGALHAADVGISVNTATDVAREAADLVMMESGLRVVTDGVDEGRRIFANTMKYVFVTTSANFGNMFSMAIASLALPFLPLLPKQILLNNFLSDLPAMAIASDDVDAELIAMPRRWQIKHVRNFMLVFGLQSSVFDLLSFAVLLMLLHSDAAQFRTGWFIESAVSEVLILLIIRTQRPFFHSMPGRTLLLATIAVGAFVIVLPYLRFAADLGFEPLSVRTVGLIVVVLAAYVVTAELLKRRFMRVVGGL